MAKQKGEQFDQENTRKVVDVDAVVEWEGLRTNRLAVPAISDADRELSFLRQMRHLAEELVRLEIEQERAAKAAVEQAPLVQTGKP